MLVSDRIAKSGRPIVQPLDAYRESQSRPSLPSTHDFGSEDREGRQDSTVSVFTRDADGTLRHFYSAHPWMAPDVKERGIDCSLLCGTSWA